MIGVWHANNLQETKIETLETKSEHLEIDETGNTVINSNLLINSPQQTVDFCEPNKITIEGNIIAKHLNGFNLFRPSMDNGAGHATSGERISCVVGKNKDKALYSTFGISHRDNINFDFTRFNLMSDDHTYRGRTSQTNQYKNEIAMFPWCVWLTKPLQVNCFSGEYSKIYANNDALGAAGSFTGLTFSIWGAPYTETDLTSSYSYGGLLWERLASGSSGRLHLCANPTAATDINLDEDHSVLYVSNHEDLHGGVRHCQINGTLVVTGTINGQTIGSHTITHDTEYTGSLQLGTFCETIGSVYYEIQPTELKRVRVTEQLKDEEGNLLYNEDGTPKIGEVIKYEEIEHPKTTAYENCICKVKQSETRNKNIVGVVTYIGSDNKCRFATHGDVLVKVIPATYSIGDVLVPYTGGLVKKGTSEEIMDCLVNGIPKLKITSLETKIPNTVAALFI